MDGGLEELCDALDELVVEHPQWMEIAGSEECTVHGLRWFWSRVLFDLCAICQPADSAAHLEPMFAKFAGGLSALTGFGSSFPYTLEEPAYSSAWGQWAHHKGTAKEDGARVSIFKISAEDPNDRRLVIARNGVKRLKMVRHPNILSFKDSHEITERGQTIIYLITQPVQPLKMVLEELSLEGQHRREGGSGNVLPATVNFVCPVLVSMDLSMVDG